MNKKIFILPICLILAGCGSNNNDANTNIETKTGIEYESEIYKENETQELIFPAETEDENYTIEKLDGTVPINVTSMDDFFYNLSINGQPIKFGKTTIDDIKAIMGEPTEIEEEDQRYKMIYIIEKDDILDKSFKFMFSIIDGEYYLDMIDCYLGIDQEDGFADYNGFTNLFSSNVDIISVQDLFGEDFTIYNNGKGSGYYFDGNKEVELDFDNNKLSGYHIKISSYEDPDYLKKLHFSEDGITFHEFSWNDLQPTLLYATKAEEMDSSDPEITLLFLLKTDYAIFDYDKENIADHIKIESKDGTKIEKDILPIYLQNNNYIFYPFRINDQTDINNLVLSVGDNKFNVSEIPATTTDEVKDFESLLDTNNGYFYTEWMLNYLSTVDIDEKQYEVIGFELDVNSLDSDAATFNTNSFELYTRDGQLLSDAVGAVSSYINCKNNTLIVGTLWDSDSIDAKKITEEMSNHGIVIHYKNPEGVDMEYNVIY